MQTFFFKHNFISKANIKESRERFFSPQTPLAEETNKKALEFGAFFAYFPPFWYLKVLHFQNCAKTFHFRQAFRQKNHLKTALQVSKLASSL